MKALIVALVTVFLTGCETMEQVRQLRASRGYRPTAYQGYKPAWQSPSIYNHYRPPVPAQQTTSTRRIVDYGGTATIKPHFTNPLTGKTESWTDGKGNYYRPTGSGGFTDQNGNRYQKNARGWSLVK